jgi:protein TonB
VLSAPTAAPTTACLAPPPAASELPPAARRTLTAAVLAAHLAGGWALLQVDAVRAAVAQAAPLMVDLIAPAPEVVPPPPPPPASPKPVERKPRPVVTAAPRPAAEPPVFVAPPVPVEPPAPEPVVAEVAPPAPPAPPPPAPPPQPKTIPATAVQYLEPPAPSYPLASRRFGEAGRVVVRVLIDEQGRPADLRLQASSGHRRLDDSALAALRTTRFRPYTENGVAQRVWALVPIHFELES